MCCCVIQKRPVCVQNTVLSREDVYFLDGRWHKEEEDDDDDGTTSTTAAVVVAGDDSFWILVIVIVGIFVDDNVHGRFPSISPCNKKNNCQDENNNHGPSSLWVSFFCRNNNNNNNNNNSLFLFLSYFQCSFVVPSCSVLFDTTMYRIDSLVVVIIHHV